MDVGDELVGARNRVGVELGASHFSRLGGYECCVQCQLVGVPIEVVEVDVVGETVVLKAEGCGFGEGE